MADEIKTVMSATAGPLPTREFAPPHDYRAAPHSFDCELVIEGSDMFSNRESMARRHVLDGRPLRFPSVRISFATHGDELIPIHSGLIRQPDPASYWDIMVGTGRIWSEDGCNERTRVAFPFQLSNERENDTHHGLVRFLWDGRHVRDLEVQVVTETRPDHIPADADLWGTLRAGSKAVPEPVAEHARATRDVEPVLPMRSLDELRDSSNDALFDALETGYGSDTEIVSGLVIDGTIYTTEWRTRHGPFPYPRDMRFGIWSATKAAFGTTALMRLARLYGREVADIRVVDVVDRVAGCVGWEEVTIRDCLNMATGIGTAGTDANCLDIHGDNLTDSVWSGTGGYEEACYRAYQDWYSARSLNDKLQAALVCPSYDWGPGRIARYRDQDLFMAGVAMDAFLQKQRGRQANLFTMVRDEVFKPAGMNRVCMNHTLESDGSRGVPLTAFGLFLGVEDVAMLGSLLTGGGAIGADQILDPGIVSDCLDGAFDKGLPTGTVTSDGEMVTYHLAYWQIPMTTMCGRKIRIPTMRGYGGQVIQPLSNGMTCFRFAHDAPNEQERFDSLKLVRIADALRPL